MLLRGNIFELVSQHISRFAASLRPEWIAEAFGPVRQSERFLLIVDCSAFWRPLHQRVEHLQL